MDGFRFEQPSTNNHQPALETVRIDTSQNVAIEYNVASIVSRGLASVLDWLILAGYTILFLQIVQWLDLDGLPNWFYLLGLGSLMMLIGGVWLFNLCKIEF